MHKLPKLMFLLFVFVVFCPATVLASNNKDNLTPCYSPLMGMDVINEYYYSLRKLLTIKEEGIENPIEIIKMIRTPAFASESMFAIFQKENKSYYLLNLKPSHSIWYSLQGKIIPPEFWDEKIVPLEKITINKTIKVIPQKLALSVKQVIQYMVLNSKIPDQLAPKGLDGTTHYYSSNDGLCGYTLLSEGPKTIALYELGDELIKYSETSTNSESIENKLYEYSNKLHLLICSENPKSEICQ